MERLYGRVKKDKISEATNLLPFPFLFSDNDRFFPIAGYLDRDRGGGEKSPISFGGEEGEDPVPLARDKGRDYR